MIGIGSDHGGYALKRHLLEYLKEKGVECSDFGTRSDDSCDYPDYAREVCHAVLRGECRAGILVCGTGIGISIAANKIKGIRAALCGDPYSARMARQHNNANIIALGGRVLGVNLAEEIVDAWLGAEFAGNQHQARLDKIHALEEMRSE